MLFKITFALAVPTETSIRAVVWSDLKQRAQEALPVNDAAEQAVIGFAVITPFAEAPNAVALNVIEANMFCVVMAVFPVAGCEPS